VSRPHILDESTHKREHLPPEPADIFISLLVLLTGQTPHHPPAHWTDRGRRSRCPALPDRGHDFAWRAGAGNARLDV